jgi:hypothetical protein
MRFLVDECAGPTVAGWLRKQGHEVFSVYDSATRLARPGLSFYFTTFPTIAVSSSTGS